MKIYILLCSVSLLVLSGCTGKLTGTPKKDEDKVAYAMGYNSATNLKSQGLFTNTKMFCTGFEDGFHGKEMKVKREEVTTAFQTLMKNKKEKDKVQSEENKTKGVDFLTQNKTKEGVKVTKSGLQYKVIQEGKGKKPKPNSKVSVHYKGRLIDGKEFDSSYKRNKPTEFVVDSVISGWKEGLALMQEGAKYELYIPSELGYGEKSLPNIPPNSVLVFELELLKIVE